MSPNKIKITPREDGNVRDLVSLINDNVEIRSFARIIPSMNDIFIKAVAGQL